MTAKPEPRPTMIGDVPVCSGYGCKNFGPAHKMQWSCAITGEFHGVGKGSPCFPVIRIEHAELIQLRAKSERRCGERL